MTLPNTISQRNVNRRQHQHFVGTPTFSKWQRYIKTGLNSAPQTARVLTITVSDPGDDTDIEYAIEDVSITTNTGTGNDASAIATLIADDINETPGARALVSATTSGADVILTATYPGIEVDFDDSDTNLSEAETTAEDAADAIGIGLGVIETGIDTEPGSPVAQNEVTTLMQLAASSALTAQVDTLALTYDAAVEAVVAVKVNGNWYRVSTAQATDADTSVIELVAQLNAVLPANTVAATHPDADTITLTAEIAGLPFEVMFGFGDSRDSGAWVHTSNAGPLTDINEALGGITVRPYDEETTTVGGTVLEYPANAGVRALEKGTIAVENTQTVSFGDPVYIELGSTNTGQFFNTSSSTRVLLKHAKWRRDLRDDAAELEFDFGLGNY